MTVQDTRGNLHGQDGRFTQKPLNPGQDLDAAAPFSLDGEDTWNPTPATTTPPTRTGRNKRSFLPGWQQAEQTFQQRLATMPTRFYTTNLAEKLDLNKIPNWNQDYPETPRTPAEQVRFLRARQAWGNGHTIHALTQAASTPDDARNQTLDEAGIIAARLGFNNLRIADDGDGNSLYADYGGKTYRFNPAPRGKLYNTYLYRNHGMHHLAAPEETPRFGDCVTGADIEAAVIESGGKITEHKTYTGNWGCPAGHIWYERDNIEYAVVWNENPEGGKPLIRCKKGMPNTIPSKYVNASTRSLVGAWRIKQATGHSVYDLVDERDMDQHAQVISSVLEAQEFGTQVLAQRKYADNTGKKLAAAWEDKKHPNKTHQQAAENSRLHGSGFGKIEIDNDVDLSEFTDFEQAVLEAQKKLPKIPEGREPDLRIRKLGKHRAAGLYVPHVNTICVDVRDSGSFVHEYGHFLDFQGAESSLGSDFGSVTRRYKDLLRGCPEGKEAYYGTPSEIWARGFELYAVEKLGIDSRLVKTQGEYGERFDYGPFREDAGLKADAFRVFDRLLEGAE